ncbi:MAG TPA: tRNA lysidine(34) synthetase TilS [Verrucomicrobiae bacterium]|jgi:tRNA(Ile)-lysidine synthase|nr:tRNA lysidine(34) synthetase TilS [Verrucomicrobiae bacterium]
MARRSATNHLPALPGLQLPGAGTKILVAVSGGLDSMVLLHTLNELSRVERWKLAVAHFNHRLRGRHSDGDEAFVQKTAGAMKLPFYSASADVEKIAKEEKISIEMAGRRLRHEFLARTAREHGARTIALAHHADDQVELFFLRLLRGAGSGLGGMQWRSPSPADSRVSLVRPLLDIPRVALEAFARENQIRYREDATNNSQDYLRNRIRHELLPLLRRNYEPGLNKTILRSMEIVGAESDLVADMAHRWLAPSTSDKANFDELPDAVQRQVLKQQIIELGLRPDFELIESIRLEPGKPVAVSVNNRISRDARGHVSRCRPLVPSFGGHSVTVILRRPGLVFFDGVRFVWGTGTAPKQFRPPRKPAAGKEVFDADKIGHEIVLRHWRVGDRFQPIGMGAAVKLQDLFTNAKVPRERRHQLIVAEAEDGIFWVEGMRIAEPFKVTAGTERLLVWKWRRNGS